MGLHTRHRLGTLSLFERDGRTKATQKGRKASGKGGRKPKGLKGPNVRQNDFFEQERKSGLTSKECFAKLVERWTRLVSALETAACCFSDVDTFQITSEQSLTSPKCEIVLF